MERGGLVGEDLGMRAPEWEKGKENVNRGYDWSLGVTRTKVEVFIEKRVLDCFGSTDTKEVCFGISKGKGKVKEILYWEIVEVSI